MIDEEYTKQLIPGATAPKLELEGLTAGSIADLCNISQEIKAGNVDGGDFAENSDAAGSNNGGQGGGGSQDEEVSHYYSPLQPFSLPVPSLPPHIEPGRVDIRLHALHSKLGKI